MKLKYPYLLWTFFQMGYPVQGHRHTAQRKMIKYAI